MQDPSAWTTRGYLGDIPRVSIFKATPASVLSRFLAWVIDLSVIFAIAVLLIAMFENSGVSTSSNTPSSRVVYQSEQEADDVASGQYLFLLFSYCVIAERITGKTVGKKVMGIKVVNKYDGEHITIWQSLGRNLLRLVDFFPFGLIGLISMERSDHNQRVGDRATGTIVIKDRKR